MKLRGVGCSSTHNSRRYSVSKGAEAGFPWCLQTDSEGSSLEHSLRIMESQEVKLSMQVEVRLVRVLKPDEGTLTFCYRSGGALESFSAVEESWVLMVRQLVV